MARLVLGVLAAMIYGHIALHAAHRRQLTHGTAQNTHSSFCLCVTRHEEGWSERRAVRSAVARFLVLPAAVENGAPSAQDDNQKGDKQDDLGRSVACLILHQFGRAATSVGPCEREAIELVELDVKACSWQQRQTQPAVRLLCICEDGVRL